MTATAWHWLGRPPRRVRVVAVQGGCGQRWSEVVRFLGADPTNLPGERVWGVRKQRTSTSRHSTGAAPGRARRLLVEEDHRGRGRSGSGGEVRVGSSADLAGLEMPTRHPVHRHVLPERRTEDVPKSAAPSRAPASRRAR